MNEKTPSEKALKAELAKREFSSFVSYTKEDYEENWHHKLICDTLDTFLDPYSGLDRLIIEAPPRSGKSELVSRKFPAYIFGKYPKHQVVLASYASSLAQRMNRDVQRVMDSPQYRELFPDSKLNDQNVAKTAKGAWVRTSDLFEIVGHGGAFRSVGVGGGLTGQGAEVCFPAGINVLTPSGSIDISQLKTGDTVWSYNHESNKAEQARVKAVSSRNVSELVYITTVKGTEILCTPEHPFWTQGRNYQEAKNLTITDELITLRLFKNKVCYLCFRLYSLWYKIREAKGRLSKKSFAWSNKIVLLKHLFKTTFQRRIKTALCAMSKTDTKQEPKILPNLQKKSFRQKWVKVRVRQKFQSYFTPDYVKGQLRVLCLLLKKIINCTPYRRKQKEQRTRESNHHVSELPQKTSPCFGADRIKSVVPVSYPSVTVYNIEVEGNHNFFAEGILVHNCIIDDPIKDWKEATSKLIKDNLLDWYQSVLYTRLSKFGKICVMNTRWAEDDLTGRLLKLAKEDSEADQWHVLRLPMVQEITEYTHELDPRKDGELLWPNRFPEKKVNSLKRSVGSRVWASLYQQRPAPDEGNLVQRNWWSFYKVQPSIEFFDYISMTWDFTFKGTDNSDYVVGQVWGRKGSMYYLLDQVRAKMNFTATVQAVKSLAAKWPKYREIIVEEKANGAAIIDTLKKEIRGIVPYSPKESKEARASSITPLIEAGNIFLPDPSLASWVNDYIEEWAVFPNGAHDDQIDATSQMLIRFTKTKTFLEVLSAEEEQEKSTTGLSKSLMENLWGNKGKSALDF